MKPICKRCLIDTGAFTREAITKQLDSIPRDERAAASVIDKRLRVCRSCAKLMGATCSDCGFFAEVRAACKASACPNGHW